MNKLCALVCVTGAVLLVSSAGLANSAPRADSQVVYVLPGRPAAFRLNGSDQDGNALTYRVTGLPSSGVLSGSAPDLVYTPSLAFGGRDQLAFVVQDPFGEFDIGLVEFRAETTPAVLRVGPAGPDDVVDPSIERLAFMLTGLGVRLWYVASTPTLSCAIGEAAPFLIAGWTGEPKVLAFGPRENPTLIHVSWDPEERLADLSGLAAGSYLVVAVLGSEAVSFPAIVYAKRGMTQVASAEGLPGR